MRAPARRCAPGSAAPERRHAQGCANSFPSRVVITKPVPSQRSQAMTTSLVQGAAQCLRVLAAAQLLLGPALDLPHALAGELEPLPDLLQGPRVVAVEAEAQADHLALLSLEAGHHVADLLLHVVPDERELGRRHGVLL